MRILSSAIFALIVLAAPVVSRASTVYYLNTGQATANTTIDAAHATAWYSPNLVAPTATGVTFVSTAVPAFNDTFSWVLGGGDFTLKEGAQATANITFALWDYGTIAVPTTAAMVDSITWTAADITQSYTSTPMYFTDNGLKSGVITPFTLVLGHQYIAELTSTASTAGSAQFFIKDPTTVTIQDAGGGNLGGSPEPGTWILALTGVAGLFAVRKIRAKRKVSSSVQENPEPQYSL